MKRVILEQKAIAKVGVIFLLLIIFSFFIWSVPVKADTATDLITQLNSISGLTATPDDTNPNIVNVTGNVADVSTTLNLDINSDVRINWGAYFVSNSIFDGSLINLTNDGTFAVTSTGAVYNKNKGRTISSNSTNATILIDSGEVRANSGSAIYMTGQNATATVTNRGSVYSEATTNAQAVIHMTYGNSGESNINTNVNIDNGSVAAILDDGNAYAIQTYGDITISNGSHIFDMGEKGGRAINALGADSTITLSEDSKVWSYSGITIHTSGANAEVIVKDNAEIYNDPISVNYPAIQMDAGTGSNVTVSGNGKVYTEKDGVTAIKTTGNVIVKDNAQITATTGFAVDGSVTVNGGIVFAYGNALGEVVKNGAYTISLDSGKDGAVVAWDIDADVTTYLEGTVGNLTFVPASAVSWKKNNTQDGIKYGVNGFFEIPEVTVNVPTLVMNALSNETAIIDTPYSKNVSYNYTYGTDTVSFSAAGLPNGLTIDTSTGTISGTPTSTGVYTITVTTTAGSLTDSESYTLEVLPIEYKISTTGVTLNKDTTNIEVGNSETLIATVLPDDASDKSVIWLSSDPSVATVDENGKVTAIKNGIAVITVVTNDGELTDSCTVTVTNVGTNNASGAENPSTGDGNVRLWVTMLCASLLVIVSVIIYKQKK